MKEVRYSYVPDAANLVELPAEEATHALRVLRLKGGDEIFLMDGEGSFFRAEVTAASSKRCLYEIKEEMPQQRAWKGHIHLAIAPTKMMERIEWMAEKATEIGFDELSFLNCQFSERKVVKTPRIDKIVISAVKQSHKAWKPVVNELVSFKEFIQTPRPGRKFICHCYEEVEKKDFFTEISGILNEAHAPAATESSNADVATAASESPTADVATAASESPTADAADITVLVGPEGDFSIDEVRLALENGYESVSLGTSRLRTETAGLVAVHMAHIARRL